MKPIQSLWDQLMLTQNETEPSWTDESTRISSIEFKAPKTLTVMFVDKLDRTSSWQVKVTRAHYDKCNFENRVIGNINGLPLIEV